MPNLLQAWGLAGIDVTELEQFLRWTSQASYPDNETMVLGKDGEPTLTLSVAPGESPSLVPSEGFGQEALESLRRNLTDALLQPGPAQVAVVVMFAHKPVAGHFKWHDAFQLIPMPQDAPQPDALYAPYPFLLEVAFTGSTDIRTSMFRGQKRAREIELVCSLLLRDRVHAEGQRAGYVWTIAVGEQVSKLGMQRYNWPGAQGLRDGFSNRTGIPPLEALDVEGYYTNPFQQGHVHLTVPNTLAEGFDRFSRLAAVDREKFLRACYWRQKAELTAFTSQSMAFGALVSAVEAILGDDRRGRTAQFVAFVDRFAPAAPETGRRRLYDLRSKISHGGKLLHVDQGSWGIGLHGVDDFRDFDDMADIARVALYNWLFSDDRPQN